MVQISLLDDEYEYLEEQARIEGVTIPLLIKNRVIQSGRRVDYFNKLLQLVDATSRGRVFSISDLFGDEWKDIDRGIRQSMGNIFLKCVRNGAIENVAALPNKNSADVQLYRKI